MSGLIWKDLMVLRKTLKTHGLFFLFYFLMAAVGLFNISFVTAVLQLIVIMLPMSAFAYDEQAKWDRYAIALPLGRRRVVAARYLFTLLMVLIAAAFSLLTCTVISITGNGLFLENLAAVLTTLGLGLLVADLLLPLNYKLGPERSRPYLYAIVFLPVIALVGAAQLGWLDWLDQVPESYVISLFALAALLPLLGFPVSWLVSCRIMERKEV